MQSHFYKNLENSLLLYDRVQIDKCVANIADAINKENYPTPPLFLTIMNGGMFFAVNLMQQIRQIIYIDYIHVSRYGGKATGGEINWYRKPDLDKIVHRNIYLVDDILDEGYTLAAVKRFLLDSGASSCKIVVLVDKQLGKIKPVAADYNCLLAPNKFLFGYGMEDLDGFYRNLPDIRMHR